MTPSTVEGLKLIKITAKHLEPLKGGKIPVEILVTTKDPESKAKAFEKCLDVIKNAGVSIYYHYLYDVCVVLTLSRRRRLVPCPKMRPLAHLQKTGNALLGTFQRTSRKLILLLRSLQLLSLSRALRSWYVVLFPYPYLQHKLIDAGFRYRCVTQLEPAVVSCQNILWTRCRNYWTKAKA